MHDIGPFRTLLFVPANRSELVGKALGTGADAVILDLEDAVPPDQKAEARAQARDAVIQHSSRRILVRLNGLESGLFSRDVREVVHPNLMAVMVPKVETAEQIQAIHRYLLEQETILNLEPGSVAVIPLFETALAVQNAYRIVSETTDPPRVYTAAFGAADYTLEMGIELTKHGAELDYPRSSIAVACRAAGLAPPLDTPFMVDLNDEAALVADAGRGKTLGYQGKMCVHPKQVGPCNAVFSPSDEEIRYARELVGAYEEAQARGSGVLQRDGRFIDLPIVERCRRTLKMAALLRKSSGSRKA